MKKNTTLLFAASLIGIVGIGMFSAYAINISPSSLQGVAPILKQIIFKDQGAAGNATGVVLDASGVYMNESAPFAINANSIHVLKLDNNQKFYQGTVNGADIATGAIGSNHIINNSITNNNFANYSITTTNILNNTLTISVFDPNITWPTGGALYWTTPSICAAGTALTGIVGGTNQCAPIVGGSPTLPNCGAATGLVLTTSNTGALICTAAMIGSTSFDSYWSGLATGNIRDTNIGNVGVGLANPTETLHVQDRFRVDQGSSTGVAATVWCDALATTIPLATFTVDMCAVCPVGYVYNPTIHMCEDPSCSGTGCRGVFNRSDEINDLNSVQSSGIPRCSCDLTPDTEECWPAANDITVDYPGLPWQANFAYPTLPGFPTMWGLSYVVLDDNVTDCYDEITGGADAVVYHRLGYTNNQTTCDAGHCEGVYNESESLGDLHDTTNLGIPQCPCDLDPNAGECTTNPDITATYPTLPYQPTAGYPGLPPGVSVWNPGYFERADIGTDCYDQIDDSNVKIYHRLGYTNGQETCDGTHDEHGVCGPANGGTRVSAAAAAAAGLCTSGTPIPGTLSDPGPRAWHCAGTNDGQDCSAEQGDAVCGDGIVQVGEACDDANVDNTDGCDDKCNSSITPAMLGCIEDPSLEIRQFTIGDVDNFDPAVHLPAPRTPSITYTNFVHTYLNGIPGMPAGGIGDFDNDNRDQYYLAQGSIPKCYNGKKLACAGVELKAKEVGGQIQTDNLSLLTKDATALPGSPAGPYSRGGLASYFSYQCALDSNLFLQYSNGPGQDFWLNLTACPVDFINSILAGNEHVYVWGNDDHNPDYINVYAGYMPDPDCNSGPGGSVGAGGTPVEGWTPETPIRMNAPGYMSEGGSCRVGNPCSTSDECGGAPNTCDKGACLCNAACVEGARCSRDNECGAGTCDMNNLACVCR